MTESDAFRLVGLTASPYTRKMVALLRYRRIPYRIYWGNPADVLDDLGIDHPKPMLMPTFLVERNGKTQAICDSTPMIRDLEREYSQRSVIPADPAASFIDYLIEDFGDEWCTKYVFHYRWYEKADAENAGTILPYTMDAGLSREQHAALKASFSERQISRLYVVGSNETTAATIEASYRRFLSALENHLARQPFMFGRRPGAGDFALYGQLTQLVGFDPTPRAIAHELASRAVAWVDRVEDLCGLEAAGHDWMDVDDMADSLRGILTEIGRVYVPALLANAEAVAAGEGAWETNIDGAAWVQKAFPYQAKCLRWINEQYQSLPGDSKARVDALLAGTGCETALVETAQN